MKSIIRAALATSRTSLQTIMHRIPRHACLSWPSCLACQRHHGEYCVLGVGGAKSVEVFLVGQTYTTKDFAEEQIDSINATIYAAMHDADNHQIDAYVRNGRFARINARTCVAERDMQRSMLCPWNTHQS